MSTEPTLTKKNGEPFSFKQLLMHIFRGPRAVSLWSIIALLQLLLSQETLNDREIILAPCKLEMH